MDVRTVCLGLLLGGDRTGYEIRKQVDAGALAHVTEASFGSIYPALTRLTQEGLVTVRVEPARGGPEKKVYSITPEGRLAFEAALSGDLPEDRFRSAFLFAMLFADRLQPGRIAALIDLQTAALRRKLAIIDTALRVAATPGERLVAEMGRASYGAALRVLEDFRLTVPSGRAAAPAAALEGQLL